MLNVYRALAIHGGGEKPHITYVSAPSSEVAIAKLKNEGFTIIWIAQLTQAELDAV